ncbi:unnamed protein product [Closterium sp. Yama58-4]|nr:unnamed protein product [Closterium sp. Yama58-4]
MPSKMAQRVRSLAIIILFACIAVSDTSGVTAQPSLRWRKALNVSTVFNAAKFGAGTQSTRSGFIGLPYSMLPVPLAPLAPPASLPHPRFSRPSPRSRSSHPRRPSHPRSPSQPPAPLIPAAPSLVPPPSSWSPLSQSWSQARPGSHLFVWPLLLSRAPQSHFISSPPAVV